MQKLLILYLFFTVKGFHLYSSPRCLLVQLFHQKNTGISTPAKQPLEQLYGHIKSIRLIIMGLCFFKKDKLVAISRRLNTYPGLLW